MDEEHTRRTIMNFLQIIAFIYLLVHIFYYVFNLFNLKIYLTTAFDSRLEFTILVHLVRALQLPKSGVHWHCDWKRDCGVRSIIIYLVLCLLIYRGVWILYQAVNLCLLHVCQIYFSYCHDGVPSTSVLAV